DHWDARHDSSAFTFTRRFALTAMGNRLAFWNRETFGIRLEPGIDEVALALVADAWSRTYRSHALTFAAGASAVETQNGLHIIPDRTAADWPKAETLSAAQGRRPKEALDETLRQIATRYGN